MVMRAENTAVLLGLGSSLGNRKRHLELAARILNVHPRIDVIRSSRIYSSVPHGGVAQGAFWNVVLRIETDLSPEGLLEVCHQVEARVGRRKTIRWSDRTIDVDILMMGDIQRAWQPDIDLTIPHPRFLERDFCVIPAREIAPDAIHPAKNCTLQELNLDHDGTPRPIGCLQY